MSARSVILLTGASGQVGWELRRALMVLGHVVAPGREELDLARPETLADVVRRVQPQWVVNPAAYTAVDKAESERELAHAVNARAPGALAEAAGRIGAGIIHFSTDYVYDGAKRSPYTEADATAPLNWYGETKLEGERAVVASGTPALIFRTSWVYGGHGNNFVRTMQRLLREREQLSVVEDQIGAPTWARAIAEATTAVIARCAHPERLAAEAGVYHLSCAGQTSWHGFAGAIRERLRARDPQTPLAQLKAIASDQYPTPAARSPYSVLDNRKLEERFGVRLPDWRECFALAAAEFGL